MKRFLALPSRLNRTSYLIFNLALFSAYLVGATLIGRFSTPLEQIIRSSQLFSIDVLPMIFFLCALAGIWLVYSARRLHDFGSSGIWLIILPVPFVNLVLLLTLFLNPSSKEMNKYGEPTRGIKPLATIRDKE